MDAIASKLIASSAVLVLVWAVGYGFRSPRLTRTTWLLFSYGFYLLWGGPGPLCLLIFSSVINYVLGVFLRRNPVAWRLGIGIGFNLLLLSTFKYLSGTAGSYFFGSMLSRLQHVILPLGISFWTFQALSYLFDIYREQEDSDPTLLEFCLYMAYWPTVVSGPICRTDAMVPQFRRAERPQWSDLANGTRRLCLGVFMLAVSQALSLGIAGQGLDAAFARTNVRWTGSDVWLLTIGYGFQLFFNFAGYSHVVIAAARLFGIVLQENFDRPFLASTLSTFWTRWHMSLSFWIRDYVFMPLAMRWRSLWWRNFTLIISMILFGLWHGATWLFVLWGAYHGILLVLHRLWQQLRIRTAMPRVANATLPVLSWCFTFGAVSAGWILFRAQNWPQALQMIRALINWKSYGTFILPPACRFLIILTAVAYFLALGISSLLDRVASSPSVEWEKVGYISLALRALSRERWVWVAPVAAVIALYGFILVGHLPKSGSPLLYRLF